MKTVHDLKNPIFVISQLVNDKELDMKSLRSSANNEIEDLHDMLDNLRLEFKTKQGMNIDEKFREVKIKELTRGLTRAHTLLAKNGKNKLVIDSQVTFPDKI